MCTLDSGVLGYVLLAMAAVTGGVLCWLGRPEGREETKEFFADWFRAYSYWVAVTVTGAAVLCAIQ